MPSFEQRLFDTHLHTQFSPDGRSSLAEYAALVDQGRADALGFTEHYEFWPGSDACGYFREDEYLAAVASWRTRGYEFYAGVEADWMPAYEAQIRDHLRAPPLRLRHRFGPQPALGVGVGSGHFNVHRRRRLRPGHYRVS